MADMLLSRDTSPSGAVARAETRDLLIRALEEMSPLDREVLVLRHYEQLSNGDAARLLGIGKTTASSRYMRALRRLGEIYSTLDGAEPEALAP
jgi:RNA polymerase sigma-70 factor (ECF subfamily)